jgi:glycerophosphoryl diester phosphodiesterase
VFGHRGSPVTHAENTVPSFRHAIDVGADGLEMDVHVTRDGFVVVSHDDSGLRATGVDRSICQSTFADVQTWVPQSPTGRDEKTQIPSLEAVLSEFPAVPMSIDIKPRDLRATTRVLEVLRSCRAQANVRLASFHHAVLQRVRALGYEGATGLSRREVAYCTFLPKHLAGALVKGTAAQVPMRWAPRWVSDAAKVTGRGSHFGDFANAAFLAKAKALGLEVHFWTVNDPQLARSLADLGADALITDDPALLVRALREH